MPPIRPRLQAELDRADQPVLLGCGSERDAAFAQAGNHALPVRCGLGSFDRQDEADRRAAPDRVLKQLDQLIPPARGLVRVERPDDDQLADAVQLGRPSIG